MMNNNNTQSTGDQFISTPNRMQESRFLFSFFSLSRVNSTFLRTKHLSTQGRVEQRIIKF